MGINVTDQFIKFIIQESVLEIAAFSQFKVVLMYNNIYMDGTMYGFICSNYMMICKTKYIEDLMLIYMFLSITLREEGKFTINPTKRCLFRLSDMQPVECPFPVLGGKFFLSPYVFCAGAFCNI